MLLYMSYWHTNSKTSVKCYWTEAPQHSFKRILFNCTQSKVEITQSQEIPLVLRRLYSPSLENQWSNYIQVIKLSLMKTILDYTVFISVYKDSKLFSGICILEEPHRDSIEWLYLNNCYLKRVDFLNLFTYCLLINDSFSNANLLSATVFKVSLRKRNSALVCCTLHSCLCSLMIFP